MKTWLVRLGQLALTVLVTWFILDRTGLSLHQLAKQDLSSWVPDVRMLVAASLVLVLGYGFSAALWGRLVMDLGGPRLSVPDSIRLFMIANLGRYVPGKVWQIAGLAVLARRKGVPAVTATGAAVLGQGLALVAATGVGLVAVFAGPPAWRRWGWVAAAVIGLAVVLTAIPSVFRWGAGLWFRIARQEAPSGLGSVHGLQWLALYGINWVVYAAAFWMMAASFGHAAHPALVGSAFAAAYVVGYVAIFAPAGAGVREVTLVAFLTPTMGAVAAGTVAVIARIWMTIIELVPAGAFWLRHVTVGPEPPADREDRGGE